MMGYTNSLILLFVVGLIVIGIIALIIYALVRATHTSASGTSGSFASDETHDDRTSRALAILAERYAKGEISDDEYKQKKSEIKRS